VNEKGIAAKPVVESPTALRTFGLSVTGSIEGVLRLKRTPFMVIDLVSPSLMEMGPAGNGKITSCVSQFLIPPVLKR